MGRIEQSSEAKVFVFAALRWVAPLLALSPTLSHQKVTYVNREHSSASSAHLMFGIHQVLCVELRGAVVATTTSCATTFCYQTNRLVLGRTPESNTGPALPCLVLSVLSCPVHCLTVPRSAHPPPTLSRLVQQPRRRPVSAASEPSRTDPRGRSRR